MDSTIGFGGAFSFRKREYLGKRKLILEETD